MSCIHRKFLERCGCEPSGSREVSWARRTGCQGLGAADAPYGRVIQTLLRIRYFLQQKVNGRKATICLPVLSMKFNTLIPFKESKKWGITEGTDGTLATTQPRTSWFCSFPHNWTLLMSCTLHWGHTTHKGHSFVFQRLHFVLIWKV